MWLLSTDCAELKYFDGPADMRLALDGGYAILSHTWGDEEQSFQDIQALRSQAPASSDDSPRSRASDKIRDCCRLAESHGYRWVWIDTCCIDKTSSSELSEAINSMFEWYLKAAVCYAYLSDVSSHDLGQGSEFYGSRWFTRGWTLQELIAPTSVLFVMKDWTILGTRTELVKHVEGITGIVADVLLHRCELGAVSVSRRMSWAARRRTTRTEDEAYCLMGIFGVNMPTIYGEGTAAFYRLQDEIMKISSDQTLFAWGYRATLATLLGVQNDWDKPLYFNPSTAGKNWDNHCLLSSAPSGFDENADLEPISAADAVETARTACLQLSSAGLLQSKGTTTSNATHQAKYDFTVTSQGMRSTLPIIRLSTNDGSSGLCIAVLACRGSTAEWKGAVLGLLLYPLSGLPEHHKNHMIFASDVKFNSPGSYWSYRLVMISGRVPRHDHEYTEQPFRYGDNRLYEEVTWDTIDILHHPLPYMETRFSAGYTGIPYGFHLSKWSVVEAQRWGFRPKDELPPVALRTDRFSTTFVARTRTAYEEFTVYRESERYGVTFRHSTAEGAVSSAGGISRGLSRELVPRSSLEHANLGEAQMQNWAKKFGDEDREVELIINRWLGPVRFQTNKSEVVWMQNHYLVDIKLSGRVYMAIRDKIGKHEPFLI